MCPLVHNVLTLAGALTLTHVEEPATSLRFEGTGGTVEVQVDRELGALVQTISSEGTARVWSRSGSGRLGELAAAWRERGVLRVFASVDGLLWAFGHLGDPLSLRGWDGEAWKPAQIAPGPAVTAQQQLRRDVGPDEWIRVGGTDYILDRFGVLARGPGGQWSYANLQPLGAPPVDWTPVSWEPQGDAVLFATEAGRALLGRAGDIEEVAGERRVPRLARVQFASGAWAVFDKRSVAIVGAAGRKELPLQVARPIVHRPGDDRILVQVGYPARLVEIDAQGGLRDVESVEPLETPDAAHVGLDARGSVWWWDRRRLHRWAEHGLVSRPLPCTFWGIDPGGRAYLSGPSWVVFSLALAELSLELERPEEPQETCLNFGHAAFLDADGRLRLPRVVEQDPPGNHRRIVYRFHVRRDGAWVLDPASPEFIDRACPLRWCHQCHGQQEWRVAPPAGKLETRPQGALGPDGRVLAGEPGREPVENASPLIRRSDGSAWLLGPMGLCEVAPLGEGRWRPLRLRLLGIRPGPWVQAADGEVWVVDRWGLTRVVFPGE